MGSVKHPEGGRVMTKQSDALATDVNAIIKKWITHGVAPMVSGRPTYGDFTNVGDYHGAMNKVLEAQNQFNALPSAVRAHVENDPGKFLELIFDPNRTDELESLGLIPESVPEAAPARVIVVPDPEAPATSPVPSE